VRCLRRSSRFATCWPHNPDILRRIVGAALAERLQSWASFRNVLVHAYLAIDHGTSWDAIASDLSDLREFAAIAASRL
jgi:uncharacterized protein YutE (UPF0331/DUF86 family)